MSPPRIVVADDNEGTVALLEVLIGVAQLGEVVGVARNGLEAVDLVLEHEPELALIDVEMPRLRGTQAAAAIRAYRPETRVILHTANLDEKVRSEAQALGVPLLDKMGVTSSPLETIIAENAADLGGTRARPIERLVRLALERRPAEGVIVITAERLVVFYDHLISEILGLPFPPTTMPLDEFRRGFTPVGEDGSPQPLESRPLYRALVTRSDHEGLVYERRGDELLRIHSRATTIRGADDEFLGVAAYWTVLDRSRLQ